MLMALEQEVPVPIAPPQYAEEVEALLQTPFFTDPERSEALYYDFSTLRPEDIASRALAYTKGLRILATARAREREIDKSAQAAPGIKAWNAEWLGNLTINRLRLLNQKYRTEVAEAVLTLETVHDDESDSATGEELRPLQRQYADDALRLLALPPKKVKRLVQGEMGTFYVQGVNIIGPTGFGKTAINGVLTKELCIGRPHETEKHRRKRMLVVAPSQQLVEQYAGITGDKTYTRFAKSVSVSTYYSRQKNLKGDTIVTTTDQFIEGFRDNHFFGVPVDVLAFDEVQHLTEPLVEETFLLEWRGPTIGLTATPDYSEVKDARSLLPYTVEHVDLLDSIDEGATNGAQLFTILVDCSDLEVDHLTPKEVNVLYRERRDEVIIEFLKPLFAEGRRAMVFCDQGEKAKSAVEMANQLSEIILPGGRRIVAEPITSYRPATGSKSNRETLRRYHKGKIDALTTIQTGLESLNADIDVVAFNAIYSFLKVRQLVGRGTRPSERFPVTVYVQFILPFYPGGGSLIPYTVYQAFGLERIEQGKLVVAKNRAKNSAFGGIDYSLFSPKLQALLKEVNHKTIAEVLLEKSMSKEITEGLICFDDIPRPENTSASAAKYRLDIAGYTWEGRYERGRQGMVRYYDPDAEDFFIRNPLAERLRKGATSIGDLATVYQVRYGTMRKAIEDADIPTIDLMGRGNTGAHVRNELLPLLARYMEEEMPLRRPGDISVEDLATETGTTPAFLYLLSKNNNVKAKYRRNPDAETSTDKTRQLLSKADADTLRQLFYEHPRAESTDVIKSTVRKALGIPEASRFNELLTSEEKEWLTPKWTKDAGGKLRLLDNWTKEQGEAVTARLKVELNPKLPPHLLPCAVTDKLFAVQSASVARRVADLKAAHEIIPLVSPGTKYKCIPWHTLRRLERYYFDRRPGAIEIDYDRLPISPDDQDPERIAYARSIQAKLVPKNFLDLQTESDET